MNVVELMVEKHGSVKDALNKAVSLNMTAPEIAAEYDCSRSYIRQLSIRMGIVLPVKSRSEIMRKVQASRKKPDKPAVKKSHKRYKKRPDEESLMGITSNRSRKAMTSAILTGEELSRHRLMEQVKTFKPGDPHFDTVAADILRQRETCQRKIFINID